jgi:anti-sigma factor RsiW
MKTICGNESLLGAYLDNELDDVQRHHVRRHLDTCTACQKQLAALQCADDWIREPGDTALSAGFEQRFWAKVADLDHQKALPAWRQWLQPGWRPAMAAGLAASIVLGVLMISGPEPDLSRDEMAIAENMELLMDYDLIRHLEILENWDALEAMKERS